VALLVSALTLFSGFGLGTLLMPAFALFFPLELAIAATAIVHLANNVFKLFLIGKYAKGTVVLLFGVPAIVMAIIGAMLLEAVSHLPTIVEYDIGERHFSITMVKLVIGALMLVFAIVELSPRFEKLAFPARYIPIGGALSGFFGGLSGHQGALRAAFLVRAGLTKEQFIGTTAVCSVLVDASRLVVYGSTFFLKDLGTLQSQGGINLVIAGTLAAFVGSFLGTRLVKKVTFRGIQIIVGLLLLVVAIGLGSGLLGQ
jgi:hypothetical protein